MAASSSDISPEALAPLVGEWRILAAFDNAPPAGVGARENLVIGDVWWYVRRSAAEHVSGALGPAASLWPA
jgi:hypothetical protein